MVVLGRLTRVIPGLKLVGFIFALAAFTAQAEAPVLREFASDPTKPSMGLKETVYSEYFEGSRYLVDRELGVYALMELRQENIAGWEAVRKALGSLFSEELLAPGAITIHLYNQTDSEKSVKLVGLSVFLGGDVSYDDRKVREKAIEARVPAHSYTSVELGPIPVVKFSMSASPSLTYEYAGVEMTRPLRLKRVPREAIGRANGLLFPWTRDEVCSGDPDWDYSDGCRAWREKDYELALEKLRPLAERGHSSAQWLLGFMYEYGQGLAQEPSQAVRWYRKSADQRNVRGLAGLASLYAQGIGVARDHVEAMKLYREAAEREDALATYGIGVMYDRGEGVAADPVEAARWFRKAAEMGFPPAQHKLGNMFLEGRGVTKNLEAAREWWAKAAAQGALAGTYSLSGTRGLLK